MATTPASKQDGSLPSHNGSNLYGDDFYADQFSGSYRSALIYIAHLWRFFQPSTCADFGCGRGTWLRACAEAGANELYGFDGSWNGQSNMVDPRIRFIALDLSVPFSLDRKFDLAITLEVAEHLDPKCSEQFVASIARCSNVVLFGAASPGQGGTGHLNERAPSYWAEIFNTLDYAAFDLFRPYLWADDRIDFWYRQNTFAYIRRGSDEYMQLLAVGQTELRNIGFMDCVHPSLFEGHRISPRNILATVAHKVLPISIVRKLRRWRRG